MMPAPDRIEAIELMDLRDHSLEEMEGCLRELEWVNRYLGGHRLVLAHLRRLLARAPGGQTVRILDVATGGADVPRLIVAWARRRGIRVHVTGVDISPPVVAVAHRWTRDIPEIAVLRADAFALPFADRAFDVCHLGLTLHHFSWEDSLRILHVLHRLSRTGFIVNDLRRCWSAYAGSLALARTVFRNRLTRNDGPISIMRSYTLDEARALAADAGIPGLRVHAHPLFRMALVRGPAPVDGDGTRTEASGGGRHSPQRRPDAHDGRGDAAVTMEEWRS
ncbi:MAG: methyltransferase domain-containing protein [Armatimonadetes bacterium]|nr:methyltransferase domain-containing protein [Armatimonadota bacterium]